MTPHALHLTTVIPAQAGIHTVRQVAASYPFTTTDWVPACVGMTTRFGIAGFRMRFYNSSVNLP